MEIGEKLKGLRLSQNISQKELSEKTGLTLRTIQRIENNEVKPSLHSLKTIGEALGKDLSNEDHKQPIKPYEFEFSIKITDMNQFIHDLKTLIKNNWKLLLMIAIVLALLSNYTQIKAGFLDGWHSK